MSQTRASVRHRRRFKVKLGHSSSFTSDVCSGGFSTELMRVLPPGTSVNGSILVGQREISFDGQVAWARPGDSNLNLRGRMGIRFTRIAQDLTHLEELSRS